MRGIVLAALAAAVIIALLTVWRISEKQEIELVDPAALPGAWERMESERCNPALPAHLTILEDGAYRVPNGAGKLRLDEQGRYTLQPVSPEHANRIFRANTTRLELLNRLGCKAVYARAE